MERKIHSTILMNKTNRLWVENRNNRRNDAEWYSIYNNNITVEISNQIFPQMYGLGRFVLYSLCSCCFLLLIDGIQSVAYTFKS